MIGADARSIPIVLNPAITQNKIYVLVKTCLTGIIDEIILFYSARAGCVNVEAVCVILDSVELNNIPCIHDVDAELAAIVDPVSRDGIEGSPPETYSSGAVVDDIIGDGIVIITNQDSIQTTSITNDVIGKFTEIRSA